MNWNSFRLGIPIGVLGGLSAIAVYTGVKGEEFSIFDLTQLNRMASLFFGAFVNSLVAFLLGLKTQEPWNGKIERRNGGHTEVIGPVTVNLNEPMSKDNSDVKG